MGTIKTSEIEILRSFLQNSPKKYKLDNVRSYVERHNCLDEPIVLDGKTLVDGYARYLVAIECGLDEIPYVKIQDYSKINKVNKQRSTNYVVGRFKEGGKEYIWKNSRKIPVEIGDKILVRSERNKRIVTVIDIFTSDISVMMRHKTVIAKLSTESTVTKI